MEVFNSQLPVYAFGSLAAGLCSRKGGQKYLESLFGNPDSGDIH